MFTKIYLSEIYNQMYMERVLHKMSSWLSAVGTLMCFSWAEHPPATDARD